MATKAEIRLQIVTALDKAGIKATKEQVDMMTASVMDANRKMGKSANETAGALGRMRGPVGKLTNAFSNLGGTMGKVVGVTGMVVGAFETGWAVGTKLWEGIQHIRKEWFGYTSELEKVIAANKRLAKEQKIAAEQFDASFEHSHALRQREMEDSKAALEAVKTEAEAYRTAAKAKMGLLTAGMGAEEQRLERERFEDILALQANGYDGAAVEQVEAIYDVLKAELAVKKEMAKIEAEEDAAAAKRLETRNKMTVAVDRESDALLAIAKLQEDLQKLEDWDFDDADLVSDKERKRRMRKVRGELRAAEADRDKAQREYDALAATLAPEDVESATIALRHATAVDAAMLARDRAALAYDQATANGDALGVGFTEEYANYVRRSTEQSYQALLKIQENTADYDAMLNKLLTMRGGD